MKTPVQVQQDMQRDMDFLLRMSRRLQSQSSEQSVASPWPAPVAIDSLCSPSGEAESSRRPVLSIRTETVGDEDQELADQQPVNHRRGIVTMRSASAMVKTSGQKIWLSWQPAAEGEAEGHVICSLGQQQVIRHLGSVVRTYVPMSRSHFSDYGKGKDEDSNMGMEFVYRALTGVYRIDYNSVELLKWMKRECTKLYTTWKSECHKWFKKWVEKNKTPTNPTPFPPTPIEFQDRQDDWKWLVTHFRSSHFMEVSDKASKSCKERQTIHRTGSKPLVDYAADIARENPDEPFPLPKAYEMAYDERKVANVEDKNPENLRRVQILKEAMSNYASQHSSTGSSMGPCPILDQFAIIREAAGPPKGRVQPGVGRRLKLPKLTRDSDISSLSQESIRDTIEAQVTLQVEERLRAEREHRVALETQASQVEETLRAEREQRVALEAQTSQEREKREAMELQLTQQAKELEMMRRSMEEMQKQFQKSMSSSSNSTPVPLTKFRL